MPRNVHAFLRLAQLLRKYIKYFAPIDLPLNKLLRKDKKFKRTEEGNTAFLTLKKALVTAHVLAFAQFDKPLIFDLDSSDELIGFVLSSRFWG